MVAGGEHATYWLGESIAEWDRASNTLTDVYARTHARTHARTRACLPACLPLVLFLHRPPSARWTDARPRRAQSGAAGVCVCVYKNM